MSVTKVVLLFTYWKKKIIFRELQLIFDTKNWVWKSKNALFWWLGALSFCQIWKNLLVPMNVDLKDYLILGASLGNVSPWITIVLSPNWKDPSEISQRGLTVCSTYIRDFENFLELIRSQKLKTSKLPLLFPEWMVNWF